MFSDAELWWLHKMLRNGASREELKAQIKRCKEVGCETEQIRRTIVRYLKEKYADTA